MNVEAVYGSKVTVPTTLWRGTRQVRVRVHRRVVVAATQKRSRA